MNAKKLEFYKIMFSNGIEDKQVLHQRFAKSFPFSSPEIFVTKQSVHPVL